MLAIDVGNTQTVLGYFQGAELKKSFRINTDIKRTSDEYKLIIRGLLEEISTSWNDFDSITIGSVVPRVTETLIRFKDEKNIVIVSHKSTLGFSIKVHQPQTLGADRIVTTEAAISKYGYPLIVVDCGTAITFDVINSNKEYIGGAISPGIYTSSEALFSHASKLFSTTMEKPKKVIGNTTKNHLQSGIIHGFASLIDGMIWKTKQELNEGEVKVIGTGGQIDIIAKTCASIDIVDNDLSLNGLLRIYNNEKDEK